MSVGEVVALSIQDSSGTSRAQSSTIVSLSDVISDSDQYVVYVSGLSSGDTVVWLNDGVETVSVPVSVREGEAPAPSLVGNISFNPNQLTSLYQGGRYKVTMLCNNKVDKALMTATSYADWITLVSINNARTELSFTVLENNGNERMGTIGLSWYDISGISHNSYYTVLQYASDDIEEGGSVDTIPIVVLDKSNADVSAFEQGATVNFQVLNVSGSSAYNVSFESSSSWLSIPWNNQVSFSFRASENNGASRNGYINVIATDKSSGKRGMATLSVSQDAWNGVGELEIWAYGGDSWRFSSSQTTGNFNLRLHNISSITMSSTEQWITPSLYGTIEEDPKLMLNFSENMGGERASLITVSGTTTQGTVVSDYLRVFQNANPDYQPTDGSIDAPPRLDLSWKGESGTLSVGTTNMKESTIVASKYHPLPYSLDWLTVEYDPLEGIVYSATNNTSTSARTCYVYLVGEALDGGSVSSITYVSQDAYSQPTVFPAWQDKVYTIESSDSYVDYSLVSDGNVIYEGRAYPMNGSIDVNIGEIVRGRIVQELSLENGFQDQGGFLYFDLYVDGGYAHSYITINDWSYELNSSIIKSDPIRYEALPSMLLPFSVSNTSPNAIMAECENDGNEYFLSMGNGTILYNVVEGEGEEIVMKVVGTNGVAHTRTYTVLEDCYEWYFIFRNLYSGYDSFIPKGNYKYYEDYTPSTYKRNVVNDRSGGGYIYPQRGRDRVTYQIDIKPTWEFRTDWLNDDESRLMRHLFSSDEVWLCKTGEYKYLPVSITDKKYEEKTFKNGGRKMVNYTFHCQLDETRMRR